MKETLKNNQDRCGRVIDYLRISVTDRCNLRCRYCMPEGVELVPMSEILSFEEILEIAGAAAAFGISHLKITGGEPLVRLGTPELIRDLKAIPGIETVTITTNGTLLSKYLPDLLSAGIDGINISLDTLDPDKFREITRFSELPAVLSAIRASAESGVRTKINVAVMAGVNDDETEALAALSETLPVCVRFIEMMPIGFGTRLSGMDNHALLARLRKKYPDLSPEQERLGYGPAVYYRSERLLGRIGFISAVHERFCESCNRLRLTSTGELKYCLCYENGIDLRPILRGEADRDKCRKRLLSAFEQAMREKPKAHCFEKPAEISERKAMSAIGG